MQHIGFIMDGNRRWAKKLSNIVTKGHEQGAETLEKVIEYTLDASIPYLSMWALSKENILERSEFEVTAIFGLIRYKLDRLVMMFSKYSIRFETVGDLSLLPDDIQEKIQGAKEITKDGKKLTFILGLGYSGQDEIIRGVKDFIAAGKNISELSEKSFLSFLDSGRFPPPDIIVRTGGNVRHSGYFLYQSAYSEYYFTEVLWPDFSKSDFDKVLAYYETIQRNFGK